MTLRIPFGVLALAALVSACSSGDRTAGSAARCAAQVSGQAAKEAFKINCSGATLEQLAAALHQTGRVEFKYPPELAATPLSVTVDGLPLGSVLASALQPFSYVLVREPQGAGQSPQPAQVTISGLRGTSALATNGSSAINSDADPILHPVQQASPISMPAPSASNDSPILHPAPQPFQMPASTSAAAAPRDSAILHPNPQPWTMPAPKPGATTP
jgi:hypothetical protein